MALVRQILNRVPQLAEVEETGMEELYTAADYLQELHHAVFEEWQSGQPVGASRYKIQEWYVDGLCRMLEFAGGNLSSRTIAAVMDELKHVEQDASAYVARIPSSYEQQRAKALVLRCKDIL